MQDLYERILELKEKVNITGIELGEKLGLKKSPLTDWKNNKSKPTLEQFVKMCEIFAVSPEFLLTGKEAADLSPEEQKLLEYYRNTSDTGRVSTLAVAKTNSEIMPKELESSNSKIG